MREALAFLRAIGFLVLLAALLWLASGLRWPGFSDANGDWFRFVSQISATLLGAGIAAGVTWYFAEKKRKAEQRASLQRMFLRLLYVAGGLTTLLRTIDEMLQEANEHKSTGLPLWARVKPVVGLSLPMDIDVADLVPLLDADAALANDILLLDARNRSNLSAAETYNRLRVELRDLMHVDSETGPISHTVLTKQEYLKLKPRFDELDQLVGDLLAHVREDVSFAEKIITRFSAVGKRISGKFNTVDFIRHRADE